MEIKKRCFKEILILLVLVCFFFFFSCNTGGQSSVESVSINQTTIQLELNQSTTLIASVFPAEADQTVTWASDNADIALVDKNGLVSARAIGETVITATSTSDPSKGEYCLVTVTTIDSGLQVELSRSMLTLQIGSTQQISARITPVGANQAISWASGNASIAAVDQQGNIRGIAIGTSIITATSIEDNSKTATCIVTVVGSLVPVERITIDPIEVSIEAGATNKFTAKVFPDTANQGIVWSSNNVSIATVDSDGLVTGLSVGETLIFATSAGNDSKSKFAKVTIYKIPETLTISPGDLSILITDTPYSLSTAVTPIDATPGVTWSSDNVTVVSVDDNGLVTPIGPGTAVVTAVSTIDPTKFDSCEITVIVPIDSLFISPQFPSVYVGSTLGLTAAASPANSPQEVTWSTGDKDIATVDDGGVVTGVRKGTVKIKATSVFDPSQSVYVSLSVKEVTPAANVTPESIEIAVGEVYALAVNVTPPSANQTVTWSSLTPTVASVDGAGNVTGIFPGTVFIQAAPVQAGLAVGYCVVYVVP